MKIAILGTRGVPASYGGFETLAEELGRRLVDRGHEVHVYSRSGSVDSSIREYRGMRVVVLPALGSKYLETLSHTLISAFHAAAEGFDAVLMCNAANAPFARILQIRGIPVALNVDGLERKRRKWGFAGSAYYKLCECLSATIADALITDAKVIKRYYRRRFRTASHMITYGGDLAAPLGSQYLEDLGLTSGEYLLYVSRFEPENNPDRVVEAYSRVGGDRRLVMVGSAPYAPELVKRVHDLADERVLLPGAIYGEGYRQLLFNCRCYIHATEVGGTHPALVEAMGAGRPVLYYKTPENSEVVGQAGRCFSFDGPQALETVIESLIENDDDLLALAELSAERVAQHYAWADVANLYETLLGQLC